MDIPYDHRCIAEDLFLRYTKLLQGNFYTPEYAEEVYQHCVKITRELQMYGFHIVSRFNFTVEKITVSDDTMRTVIIIKHDLALLYGIPPVVVTTASAEAHAFGSIMPDDNLPSTKCLPIEYEEYLNSLLF